MKYREPPSWNTAPYVSAEKNSTEEYPGKYGPVIRDNIMKLVKPQPSRSIIIIILSRALVSILYDNYNYVLRMTYIFFGGGDHLFQQIGYQQDTVGILFMVS